MLEPILFVLRRKKQNMKCFMNIWLSYQPLKANIKIIYKRKCRSSKKPGSAALRPVIVLKCLLSMNVRTSYDSTYHIFCYSDSSLTSWGNP